MWIDALCINQNDTQEKNAQVPNMRNIYLHGRQTYIWLGPSDVWTALAFKEIKLRAAWERKHGKGRAEVGWWQWRRIHTDLEVSSQWNDKNEDGIVTHLMAKIPFLGSLAQRSILFRPWFSRCWVVQEVAASRAITVLCGRYHIDWSDVEMAFRASSVEEYSEVCTLISVRQGFRTLGKSGLETLLWRCNTFQTTDPRDRIFSLIGLLGQDAQDLSEEHASSVDSDGICIDYNASIRDVYMEATTRCLMRNGSAGILAASLGQRETPLGKFPSWILNPTPARDDPQGVFLFAWTVSSPDFPVNKVAWTAAQNSRCTPEFDKQNGLLGLQGIIIDIVELVGAERAEPPTNTQALRLRGLVNHVKTGAENIQCYFQWRALAGVGPNEYYRGTTESTEQAFLKIMCPMMPGRKGTNLNSAHRHEQLSREFDHFVTTNFSFMKGREYGQLKKRDLVKIAARAAMILGRAGLRQIGDVEAAADFESKNIFSAGRRFVKTKQGYIGLGGPSAAVGDVLVVFAGSPAPFLIRPSGSDRYQVVSDAYFVQMMEGEMWDPRRCQTIWLR
jgi:hypothetical protein